MVLRRSLLLLFARTFIVALCLATIVTNTDAFVVGGPQRSSVSAPGQATGATPSVRAGAVAPRGLVALSERRWNFNDGQEPWGMKKNAEIWNGRVAQMAFVAIFIQELIQGRGVIQSVQDGDFINIATAGATVISVVALTAWLAIKGADDYTKKDLEGL